ncbi:MAG TPA: non-homologous end-joining DNA ligase [Longimicrobiales bacterium]|nr:non-homologous end-joining DNA ligase [Longimicrobiales bacterium]
MADADRVKITHPEKVLFPDDGITKGELVEYYRTIAPLMLPHVIRRPITMERFHRGIAEDGFFQKSVTKGFPPWLERVAVPKKNGKVHHPLVTDTDSLLWLANMNSITPHVWTSRAPDLNNPDLLVFDLDPSEVDDDALRHATLVVRETLTELGLTSWVKTTGSKGFHVAVPLDGTAGYELCSPLAHAFGRLLVERHPAVFTQEFYKADRGDRILIDTGRNEFHATYAAPYAVRAKPGAPVSAPCTWEEVEQGITQQSFTLRTMAERVGAIGDVWADLHDGGVSADGMAEALSRLRS